MKHSAKTLISVLLVLSMVMGLAFTGMGEETDQKPVTQLKAEHLSMSLEEGSDNTLRLKIIAKPFRGKDISNQMMLFYDGDCYTCKSFRMQSDFNDLSASNISSKYPVVAFSFLLREIHEKKEDSVVAIAVFEKKKTVEKSDFRLYYGYDAGYSYDGINEPDAKYLADRVWYPASSGPTPVPTLAPTPDPTLAPTSTPTAEPTPAPTAEPTSAPTAEPTLAPTSEPTAGPTLAPTSEPTAGPTLAPTSEPTAEPTAAPTPEPTPAPTLAPTSAPTATSSPAPSATPTPVPVVWGDLNHDNRVNVDDALTILRAVAGSTKLTEAELSAGDVDGKNGISVSDALCILKKIVNPGYKYPVEH